MTGGLPIMTFATAVTVLGTLLMCYSLVLVVAWFRAVAATEHREHVGHFVSLMGVFVPGIALTMLTVFVAALTGVPELVLGVALLLPGAVACGLQLEVTRLGGSDVTVDAIRVAAAVGLAAVFIAMA